MISWALRNVIYWLQQVAYWFYMVYIDFWQRGWPLSYIGEMLYAFSAIFTNVAAQLSSFDRWLTATLESLSPGAIWETIQSWIRDWLQGIEKVIAWFSGWWASVWGVIEVWWPGVQGTVKGWISAATQGLSQLLSDWLTFVTTQLPTLVSFAWLASWWNSRVLEVQGLINSGFTARESLWLGWREMRDRVTELFRDPEKWLLDKIESMLVRFW